MYTKENPLVLSHTHIDVTPDIDAFAREVMYAAVKMRDARDAWREANEGFDSAPSREAWQQLMSLRDSADKAHEEFFTLLQSVRA